MAERPTIRRFLSAAAGHQAAFLVPSWQFEWEPSTRTAAVVTGRVLW